MQYAGRRAGSRFAPTRAGDRPGANGVDRADPVNDDKKYRARQAPAPREPLGGFAGLAYNSGRRIRFRGNTSAQDHRRNRPRRRRRAFVARRPRPERAVRSIGPASSSLGAQADRLVSEPDAGQTQLQQGPGESRGRAREDNGSVTTDASRRVVPAPDRREAGIGDRAVTTIAGFPASCGEFALKAGTSLRAALELGHCAATSGLPGASMPHGSSTIGEVSG